MPVLRENIRNELALDLPVCRRGGGRPEQLSHVYHCPNPVPPWAMPRYAVVLLRQGYAFPLAAIGKLFRTKKEKERNGVSLLAQTTIARSQIKCWTVMSPSNRLICKASEGCRRVASG